MKKSVLVALTCALFLGVGYTYAVEVTLFGPKQYTRTTGSPNLYADSFPGRPGQGRIVVQNGGVDGVDLVSGAIIKVNGVEIFGTKDFNQKIQGLESFIVLDENNTISVELRSVPGSYLTIHIDQEIAPETEGLIGPEGGSIVVSNHDSPIYGTKLEIPEGAFESAHLVSLYLNPVGPSPLKGAFLQNSPVIDFVVSPPVTLFNKPVAISIPIKEFDIQAPELPLILHYNEDLGDWEPIPAFLELENNCLVFETTHFSFYYLVNLLLDPSIFNKFLEESFAFQKLIEMAERTINQGINCADIDEYIALFSDLERTSSGIMDSYVANHEKCLFGRTPDEFLHHIESLVVNSVKTKVATLGSVAILKNLFGAAAIGGAGAVIKVVGSVGAVLAFPEVVCIVNTSPANLDLWGQLAIFNFAQWGKGLAYDLFSSDVYHCSGSSGQNLIPNPSFEEFGNTESPLSWSGTYEVSSDAHSGLISAALTNYPGPYPGGWIGTSFTVATPGRYRLSVWIRSDSNIGTVLYGIDGEYLTDSAHVLGGTYEWTLNTRERDLGVGEHTFFLTWGSWVGPTGQSVIWIDDISLIRIID